MLSADNDARRNLFQNAAALIRASRGRGIIISSEAKNALGCRAPHDIINLAVIWGLKQDIATEAVTESARIVLASAQLRQRSYKGAVEVVYGGEVKEPEGEAALVDRKRKSETLADTEPKQLSKNQMRKLRKQDASKQETVSSTSNGSPIHVSQMGQ